LQHPFGRIMAPVWSQHATRLVATLQYNLLITKGKNGSESMNLRELELLAVDNLALWTTSSLVTVECT